jgi:outer membrane receptor protein involved in Fe transport
MRRGSLFAVACGVLGIIASAYGVAARADILLAIAIPAQPLDAALGEFAHQTGLQLVYLSQVTRLQASKGSRAGLSAPAALTELLEGTGLSFQLLNDRTVRIFASPIATPAVESTVAAAAPKPGARHHPPTSLDVLDEVDVTARRSERELADYIQNIPASVTIVSGDTLVAQGSERLTDYVFSVPGVYIYSAGGPGQEGLFVRGLVNGTSFYIDDIAMDATALLQGSGGPFALDLLPYDLERFEVWRGPQGTVSGAHSQIGLIRYALKRADVNDFQANVGADVTTIHGAARPGGTIHAAINVPVVEGKLGLRGSLADSYSPGYLNNLYSGERGINPVRQRSGRITALWQPAESLSVTVGALWTRITSPWWAEVNVRGVEIVPNTGDAYFVRATGSWGDLVTNQAFGDANARGLDLYSASLQWTLGSWEVHSATGWQRSSAYFQFDATPTNGIYFSYLSNGAVPPGLSLGGGSQSGEKFTEELHISSSSERLHWTVGGFYTNQTFTSLNFLYVFDKSYRPITFWGPCIACETLAPRFREQVVFGDLTAEITTHLELSAGFRYAHDVQSFESVSTGAIYPVNLSGYDMPTTYDSGHFSESAPSWRVAATYHFTPDVMLYGQVATGFFTGASQGSNPGDLPPMPGNTLTNYESGVKAQFLEGRGLVDLAVFHVRWPDIPVGSATGWTNGAHATSKGFELTSSYAFSQGLRLAYNAAYTRAAYDSVIPAAAVNLTGYQFYNVPTWSMYGSADYSWDLKDLWQARVGGRARWISSQFSSNPVQSRSLGGYPDTVLPGFSVIDVNGSVARGPFTARLFVRNLTDKRASLNATPEVDVSQPPNPVQILYKLLQPRTIGIGFEYAL